jgi:NADH:ubiquinone oxidoreductase subunit 5 (subunit L)/multisubunit Na+/H+ antiporter MnhA subunit
MLAFFIVGVLLAAGVCLTVYFWLQHKVVAETLSLDDGKGYYLIACIIIGFAAAAGAFIAGQWLGYDSNEQTSSMMALAVLLNVMASLLTLIFGLVRFHEPEQF